MNVKSLKSSLSMGIVAVAVALACAVGMLLCSSTQAFAATNVTFGYHIGSTYKEAVVDLDLIDQAILDEDNQNYLFQRNDINNVVKAGQGVTLYDAIKAALTTNGDLGALNTVWGPEKSLTIYTDEGEYTKFNAFTYNNLMALNYFYGETGYNDMPVGTGSPVATILATSSASMEIPEGMTAAQTAELLTPVKTAGPRLLWGWTSTNPGDSLMGGNRYPSGITKIVIS